MKKDDSFIADAVSEWKKVLNVPQDSQDPVDRSVQEQWDSPICEKKFHHLVDTGNGEEKAILLSTSSENASCWVHSVPVTSLGLKLDNASFKIICGLRIGAKICSPYTCRCGFKVNKYGRHAYLAQRQLGALDAMQRLTVW